MSILTCTLCGIPVDGLACVRWSYYKPTYWGRLGLALSWALGGDYRAYLCPDHKPKIYQFAHEAAKACPDQLHISVEIRSLVTNRKTTA